MQCLRKTPFVAKFYRSFITCNVYVLWEPYPSYHNGLFTPLLVLEILLPEGRSLSVLYELYETSYLLYVTLSFLCNIICYLIFVFVFSLVTLSGATTIKKSTFLWPNLRDHSLHAMFKKKTFLWPKIGSYSLHAMYKKHSFMAKS